MRLTDLSLEELANVAKNNKDNDIRKTAKELLFFRIYSPSKDKLASLLNKDIKK